MQKDSSNIKPSRENLKACSKCRQAFPANELVDVVDGFYCRDCISKTIKEGEEISKTTEDIEGIEKIDDSFNDIKRRGFDNSRRVWIMIIFEYVIFTIILITFYEFYARCVNCPSYIGSVGFGIFLIYGNILRLRLKSIGLSRKKIIFIAVLLLAGIGLIYFVIVYLTTGMILFHHRPIP